MNTAYLDSAAVAATDLLKALASPNRLRILCQLVEGERSVGQIAGAIGVRETAVSQHLALLRRDRVVRCRRSGQTVFYALDNPAASRVLEVLHEFFCPGGSVREGVDSGRIVEDAQGLAQDRQGTVAADGRSPQG
ncbi:MAG: metalloregulator ArsR/SmtB family transcription factor [Rhodospirillaceae bacterium]